MLAIIRLYSAVVRIVKQLVILLGPGSKSRYLVSDEQLADVVHVLFGPTSGHLYVAVPIRP